MLFSLASTISSSWSSLLTTYPSYVCCRSACIEDRSFKFFRSFWRYYVQQTTLNTRQDGKWKVYSYSYNNFSFISQLIIRFVGHVAKNTPYPFVIIRFNFRYKLFSSPSKQFQPSPLPKVFKLVKKELSSLVWKIKNTFQEPLFHRTICSGSGLQHCFNLIQMDKHVVACMHVVVYMLSQWNLLYHGL